MKKLTYGISGLLISFAVTANAQGLNNFANLVVENGAVLHVKSHLNNGVNGTISNAGTVRVTGNFDNAGTSSINSLVVLEGGAAQSITGNSDFHGVLEVNKTTGSTAAVSSGTTKIHGILRLANAGMNANGNLVIASTPTATGIVDDFSNAAYVGTLTGNLRVQRYIPGNTGFHYIGSAVNTASVSELSEIGLYGPDGGQVVPQQDCSPNSIEASSPYGAMFEWHENGTWLVANCQQSGWWVRSSGTMTNGRGYAAIINGGSTIEIGGAAGNTSEVTTVAYSGLSYTNATGDGWHLVSNPFPSPIQWFAPPAGFDAQAAFWQSSGAYQGTYQSIIANNTSTGLIGSSQAFYVKISSGGPFSFALPQTYRRLGNPTFYKEDFDNTFDIIVKAGGFADKTRVRFGAEGETNEFDPMFDANKLNARGQQPTLKTRLGFEEYSINSLPMEGHPMTIPMDLIPGLTGQFEFNAEHLDKFTVEAHVYLEDLKVGKIQELTINPTYKFFADESDDSERFLLHFRLNREQPISAGDDIQLYANDHSAYLFLPEVVGTAYLEVFNSLGEVVYVSSNLNEGKNTFDLSHLSTGAYVLRAMVNDKPITQKVIL